MVVFLPYATRPTRGSSERTTVEGRVHPFIALAASAVSPDPHSSSDFASLRPRTGRLFERLAAD
jgi:hypothetical protein